MSNESRCSLLVAHLLALAGPHPRSLLLLDLHPSAGAAPGTPHFARRSSRRRCLLLVAWSSFPHRRSQNSKLTRLAIKIGTLNAKRARRVAYAPAMTFEHRSDVLALELKPRVPKRAVDDCRRTLSFDENVLQ